MFTKPVLLTGALALAAPALVMAQSARDYLSIVGSSTVYPFATVVAEQFGKTSRFKTPKIEATGTGGGLKLFCAGVGARHPDLVNASRPIKDSERDACARQGVREVVELKIGYDGIAIANSRRAPPLRLSRQDLYRALAREVPSPEGDRLIPNPHQTWQQVNPELPATRIEVLGPPPTSGTRDAFVELAMEEGCARFGFLQALKKTDEKAYKLACHMVREDGAYIDAGENDNLIVQKLEANPRAVGIFGFSFLDQNGDRLQGSPVDGVAPDFEAIAAGRYPLARALFVYVKKAHVDLIPGLREYLGEFTSERAWGDEGYLADKGMIPMPKEERARYARVARQLTPLGTAR